MSEKCPHLNFAAKVVVNRIEDKGQFTADVRRNIDHKGGA